MREILPIVLGVVAGGALHRLSARSWLLTSLVLGIGVSAVVGELQESVAFAAFDGLQVFVAGVAARWCLAHLPDAEAQSKP